MIFIGRTLRSAYRKKLSSLFADLGLTLIFSFSLLIFASVGTTRFATFTTGSVIVTVGLWVVLAIGCASLVFAPFVESLVRAVQAAGVRHREGRTKRLDKKKAAEAETRKGVKEKIDRATLPTTGIVRPSETDSE